MMASVKTEYFDIDKFISEIDKRPAISDKQYYYENIVIKLKRINYGLKRLRLYRKARKRWKKRKK